MTKAVLAFGLRPLQKSQRPKSFQTILSNRRVPVDFESTASTNFATLARAFNKGRDYISDFVAVNCK